MRKPVCQYDLTDADLRSHGCTIASLAYLHREMSDGAAWSNATTFAERLRTLSGVDLPTFRARGTTLTEGRRAYEAIRIAGRVEPKASLQRGIDVREGLLPILRGGGGRLALVAVNYAEVQDAGKGVGSFRAGHAVVIGEPEDQHITVADPLRRELVRWRIGLLVRAMESFGKRPWLDGRGEAIVPSRTPTIIERLTGQRDRAVRDLAIATATIKTQGERIAALEARPPADCTAAIAAERTRTRSSLEEWLRSNL